MAVIAVLPMLALPTLALLYVLAARILRAITGAVRPAASLPAPASAPATTTTFAKAKARGSALAWVQTPAAWAPALKAHMPSLPLPRVPWVRVPSEAGMELLPTTALPPPPTPTPAAGFSIPAPGTPPAHEEQHQLVDVSDTPSTPAQSSSTPAAAQYAHNYPYAYPPLLRPAPKAFASSHTHTRPASPIARLATTPPPPPHRRSRSLGGVPVRRLSGGSTSGLRNAFGGREEHDVREGILIDISSSSSGEGEEQDAEKSASTSSDLGLGHAAHPVVGAKPLPLVDISDDEKEKVSGQEVDDAAWRWFGAPWASAGPVGAGVPRLPAVPAAVRAVLAVPVAVAPPHGQNVVMEKLIDDSDINSNIVVSGPREGALVDVSVDTVVVEKLVDDSVPADTLVDVSSDVYDPGHVHSYADAPIARASLVGSAVDPFADPMEDPFADPIPTPAKSQTTDAGLDGEWPAESEQAEQWTWAQAPSHPVWEHSAEPEEPGAEVWPSPPAARASFDIEVAPDVGEYADIEAEAQDTVSVSEMPYVEDATRAEPAEEEREVLQEQDQADEMYPDPELLPLPLPIEATYEREEKEDVEDVANEATYPDPDLLALPDTGIEFQEEVETKEAAEEDTPVAVKSLTLVQPVIAHLDLDAKIEQEEEKVEVEETAPGGHTHDLARLALEPLALAAASDKLALIHLSPTSPGPMQLVSPVPERAQPVSQTPTPPASPPPVAVHPRALKTLVHTVQSDTPAPLVVQKDVLPLLVVENVVRVDDQTRADEDKENMLPAPSPVTPAARPAWSLRADAAPALGLPAPRRVLGEANANVGAAAAEAKERKGDQVTVTEDVKEKHEVAAVDKTAQELKGEGKEDSSKVAEEVENTIAVERSPSLPGSFPEPSSTPAGEDVLAQPTGPTTQSPDPQVTPAPPKATRARAGSWALQLPARAALGLARSSPLDLALAMQMRPGLGAGADPAWMVRFLMAVYGWVVVSVAGGF